MESGGDPMKRIQLMQDYMGQATPQVIEATGRETTRRQGKEVARAGAQAKTEADIAIGEARLEMNRKISEEAESVAKQTALISAGATLLGQIATVGIPEWKKKRALEKSLEGTKLTGEGLESSGAKPGHIPFTGGSPESRKGPQGSASKGDLAWAREAPPWMEGVTRAQLQQMGRIATGEIKARPPVLAWPKGMDPKSPDAAEYVLEQFWGSFPPDERMAKYDEWLNGLDSNIPRDWKGAFDMLVTDQESRMGQAADRAADLKFEQEEKAWLKGLSPQTAPLEAARRAPLSPRRGIPGVDSPLDPLDNFGWGRMV
tara:strand:+ start:17577 stop:18521 length:945 start_codon:yes stop_codon:yes gene_type:complete